MINDYERGSVDGFEVYLKSEKPTIHWVRGDLLMAMAVASQIIHAVAGNPYRSEPGQERKSGGDYTGDP